MRAVVVGTTDVKLEPDSDADRAILAEMDKGQLWKSGSSWSPEHGILGLTVGRPGPVKPWSTDLPSRPGFYWVKDDRGGDEDIIQVYSVEGNGEAAGIESDAQSLVSLRGCLWQGPIAPRSV